MPTRDVRRRVNERLKDLHRRHLAWNEGEVSGYYPADLDEPERTRFGVSLAATDGEVYSVGDHDGPFACTRAGCTTSPDSGPTRSAYPPRAGGEWGHPGRRLRQVGHRPLLARARLLRQQRAERTRVRGDFRTPRPAVFAGASEVALLGPAELRDDA